ncbi:hypothetical protein EYC84_005566 [Monilinia fructicola]|uniref:Uncharacterized protein n=1 Tax=Monilinia fructicola TaxID=38448 RepID=A0A5M9K211_MONFR|nr:hypothetical protein EYC84_005566 [Monilinia fructicola]
MDPPSASHHSRCSTLDPRFSVPRLTSASASASASAPAPASTPTSTKLPSSPQLLSAHSPHTHPPYASTHARTHARTQALLASPLSAQHSPPLTASARPAIRGAQRTQRMSHEPNTRRYRDRSLTPHPSMREPHARVALATRVSKIFF